LIESHWQGGYAEIMEKRVRLTAILISLLMGILILGLKFYAAQLANSSALRSDALEGTVNVLAAAFGLGSLLFAEKPADRDHPYGHGKIEYFASAFEGGLISLAGVLILIDAVSRLVEPVPFRHLGTGLELNVVGGLLNGVVGLGLLITGKKYRSQILTADGVHLLTDLVSTVVLALGLALVIVTGWQWLDPVLAIGVAFFLFKTGYDLIRQSSNALLDAENPALIQRIVDHLNQTDRGDVITVHELRAQEFGRAQHVDIHVVVPEFLTVKQAHAATDAFVLSLKGLLGSESQIHTHVDPCEREYCDECPASECAIRRSPFIARKPLSFDAAVKPGEI